MQEVSKSGRKLLETEIHPLVQPHPDVTKFFKLNSWKQMEMSFIDLSHLQITFHLYNLHTRTGILETCFLRYHKLIHSWKIFSCYFYSLVLIQPPQGCHSVIVSHLIQYFSPRVLTLTLWNKAERVARSFLAFIVPLISLKFAATTIKCLGWALPLYRQLGIATLRFSW